MDGPDTPPLSRLVKFFYGAGDTGFSITYTTLDFLFAKFLLDVVGLPPALAAASIFAGRTWDWVNDPLVGFVSDRTRTRWGRRRPFLLFGAIPFALAFVLMWWVPPLSSLTALAAYYGLAYFLFDAMATLVSVPYYALTPELTPDYDERTSLNMYRMVFSILAGMIAYLAPDLISLFGNPRTGHVAVAAMFGLIAAVPLFGVYLTAEEKPGYQRGAPSSDFGDLISSLVSWVRDHTLLSGLIVMLIGGWFRVWWGNEMMIFMGALIFATAIIIRVFNYNRPFLFAMGIFLFTWTAVAVIVSILPFFVEYWLGIPDRLTEIMAMVFISALVWLPFWNWFAQRFSKRSAYVVGMLFWGGVQIALISLRPGTPLWMVLVLAALAGRGVSTAHIIPFSIIPDTLEWDELRTGARREGTYYSLVTLMNKVASSVAVPMALLLLDWAGYVPNVPQTTRSLWAIRGLVGPIPALLLSAGIVFAAFYPLSREQHARIRRLLERKQLHTGVTDS
jgi:GPH family glycoside/pentoside/hexuronide:cation symporter